MLDYVGVVPEAAKPWFLNESLKLTPNNTRSLSSLSLSLSLSRRHLRLGEWPSATAPATPATSAPGGPAALQGHRHLGWKAKRINKA